jgi:hypothetical protein
MQQPGQRPPAPQPRAPHGNGRSQWGRFTVTGLLLFGVLAAIGTVVGVLAYQATAGSDAGLMVAPTGAPGSRVTTPDVFAVTASPPPGDSQQAAGPFANGAPSAAPASAAPPSAAPASASPPPVGTLDATEVATEATVVAQRPPATTPDPDGDARRLVVVNAAPDGVRLRSEPGEGEPLMILADGTEVDATGETQEVSGRLWRQVREVSGRYGWVAADFLAAVQTTATPTMIPTAAAPTATVAPTEPPRPQPTAPPTQVPPPRPQPTAQPVATTAPPAQAVPIMPPPAAPASTVRALTPLPTAAPLAATTRTPAPPAQVTPAAAPPSKPVSPALGAGRSAPRGRDCPPSHPIKGNHSSSGEWIYHPPRGQFYSRTIPEDCFATEADARAAGYRASQR